MALSTNRPAMQFGYLQPAALDAINFSLPRDGAFTKQTLQAANAGQLQLYVGCAKWGRKEWVGNLYPPKTKESTFLDNYLLHFNSVELNATHYKIYTSEEIAGWAVKAGKTDFRFCPKVPQTISHFSDLVSPKARINNKEFLKGVAALKSHLGPVFLQLSDRFSPARAANLYAYLQRLPKKYTFFVEVRHPEWYADKNTRNTYFETLTKLGVGAVIIDTAGRRDCVHAELTIPKAFIRFTGNNLHPTDYTRMDQWVRRIRQWQLKGLQELYFFMHQPDEKFTPLACQYMVKELNRVCKLDLPLPMGDG